MARSPYLFGTRNGSLSLAVVKRLRKIADQEDVNFMYCTGAGFGNGRAWFSSRGEGMGEPFDRHMARRVMDAVEAAGIDY